MLGLASLTVVACAQTGGDPEAGPGAVTPTPITPSPKRSDEKPKPAATHTNDSRNPTDYPDQPDVVPTGQQPTAPPVPMRKPASFGSGVSARVIGTKPVRVSAKGPGEVDGAGVRFTIELRNNSGDTVSLDQVTVALYLGRNRRPALPAGPNQNNPFAGSLTDGGRRSASYTFLVPPGERDVARLEVSYTVDEPYVVFVGPVG